MKLLLTLSIALICVGLSSQNPEFEGCTDEHPVFADKNEFFAVQNRCVHVKCMEDKSHAIIPCAEEMCQPGKEIGRIDTSKIQSEVYPACCGGPICAD